MICVLPIRHQRCRFSGSAGSKGSSSEEEHRGGSGAERRSGSAGRRSGAAEGSGARAERKAPGHRPPRVSRPSHGSVLAQARSSSHPRVSLLLFHPQTGVCGTTCLSHARFRRARPEGPGEASCPAPRSLPPRAPQHGTPARPHLPFGDSAARRHPFLLPAGRAGSVGRESHYAHTSAAPAGSPPRGWEQPWRAGERHHAAAAPHPPRPEWWAKPSPTVSVPGKRRARTFAISSSRAGGRSPRRRRRGPWLGSRGIAPCRSSRGA